MYSSTYFSQFVRLGFRRVHIRCCFEKGVRGLAVLQLWTREAVFMTLRICVTDAQKIIRSL
jgi:hypothetical protein